MLHHSVSTDPTGTTHWAVGYSTNHLFPEAEPRILVQVQDAEAEQLRFPLSPDQARSLAQALHLVPVTVDAFFSIGTAIEEVSITLKTQRGSPAALTLVGIDESHGIQLAPEDAAAMAEWIEGRIAKATEVIETLRRGEVPQHSA